MSYYPSANSATSVVVPPSGYAVVGSGDQLHQQNRTYIGFETGQTAGNPTSTRMVTMNQADLTDARVVRNTADPGLRPARRRRSWASIPPNA